MDFAPEFADSIQTNPLNYDVVRYCVNIIKSKNIAFENKISTAKVTFGEKSYPLTFAADGSMYCNINLYDIADFYGTPSLTIKNGHWRTEKTMLYASMVWALHVLSIPLSFVTSNFQTPATVKIMP